MKKQLSIYPLRLPTSLKAAVTEISNADARASTSSWRGRWARRLASTTLEPG